jgi:hypothetical protein
MTIVDSDAVATIDTISGGSGEKIQIDLQVS